MQNGMAVAYASKALTKAQINYAQIEKKKCLPLYLDATDSIRSYTANKR